MAPKSKIAPMKAPVTQPDPPPIVDFSEAGEFDCAQLSVTILVFFAALVLILDVCLAHAHQIIAGMTAGGMILTAALINLFRQCCLTGLKKKQACTALSDNIILLINLFALDSFLYEESTYNHWGHSENQLKSERTLGAFLEIFIAIIATWTIYRMYKKQTEAYMKKQESFKKKRAGAGSMV